MVTAARVAFREVGFFLLILAGLWCLVGCQSGRRSIASSPSASGPTIQRLVVIGFQPAISNGDEPELVRNPVTGTSFMSWPVSKDVADRLTDQLFEMLTKEKKAFFIPPGQARGVVQSILMSNTRIGIHPIEMIKDVGMTLEADAVLVGEVYRWQDRVGTDYGIEKPASVAFDLSLVRSSDGGILWRSNYDKTQKSLMEDLLDLDTYVRSGGRWLTAEELADFGIKRLVSDMPLPPIEHEGKE